MIFRSSDGWILNFLNFLSSLQSIGSRTCSSGSFFLGGLGFLGSCDLLNDLGILSLLLCGSLLLPLGNILGLNFSLLLLLDNLLLLGLLGTLLSLFEWGFAFWLNWLNHWLLLGLSQLFDLLL